jgi:integrase
MNFKVKNLLRKGQLWFYYRGVPRDLRAYYGGKQFIRLSLKTHDLMAATQACEALTAEHDKLWEVLRSDGGLEQTAEQVKDGAERLLAAMGTEHYGIARGRPVTKLRDHLTKKHGAFVPDNTLTADGKLWLDMSQMERFKKLTAAELEACTLAAADPRLITLSEARDFYLGEHTRGSEHKFKTNVTSTVKKAIGVIGDKALRNLNRDDARKVRDALAEGGRKTNTVRRYLTTICAVINLSIKEKSLGCQNAFEGLQIAGEGKDAEVRNPFTRAELLTVSSAALVRNDVCAWVAALQVETGLRMAEAALLMAEDVHLDGEIPYIDIREHAEHGRGLKTGESSARLVPLQGCALWAVRSALAASGDSPWLFPKYGEGLRAGLADYDVNGWIRSLGIDRTSHCFRHSMIDRLLNADISATLAERLTGHSKRTIHDKYGSGFTLQKYAAALAKVALPFQDPGAATSTSPH